MNYNKTFFKLHIRNIEQLKKIDHTLGYYFKEILDIERIRRETKKDHIYIAFCGEEEQNNNRKITSDCFKWEEIQLDWIGWNPPDDFDNIDGFDFFIREGYKYHGNIIHHQRKMKLDKIISI